MIKTIPSGAMVQLGGEEVAAAPAVFKGIAPGKYPVRIILPDYETAELEAEIKPDDGEETGLLFSMKSGGSSTTTHHHRHSKTPPPSPLAKLGDSIKSFFSGGTPPKSSSR